MRFDVSEVEILFDEFIKIEKARLSWEQFDGKMGEERVRYVIRRGDSVGIIPVCAASGKIILIRQFRYPASRGSDDGYLWEIPAGMIDGDENPADTARRELVEETGLRPDTVQPLASFFLSPGLLDEKIHLFIAHISDCSEMKLIGGLKKEHEDLLIRMFSMEELFQMIRENTIKDGKTISGLLSYCCFFKRND